MDLDWIQPTLRTVRIIWATILAGTVIMAGVGLGLTWPPSVSGREPLYALAAAATVLAGASFLVPRHLFRSTVLRMAIDRLSREAVQVRLARMYLLYAIVGAALREAIAVLGLLVCVLGGATGIALIFFVLSWLLLLLAYPSPNQAAQLIDRHVPSEFWQ